MLITSELAKAVRRKQADLSMKNKDVAREMDISQPTYAKVIKGNYNAYPTIYAKAVEWLAKDY
ncbi:DNA-binding protein [Pseudolactococcus insecticola]|uniref:HTH cro/C1-type domain-containing protein n=1 Tax=Pseudolactococcus insecticola TaxID=2709158 RepID=A0A6A0B9G4_9LACT|nr:DNA-binding protein [Lactococcus insecticola]GFH41446.1 hypothetical protein Hs20B_18440 [Lactococcus insecticola]